MDEAVRGRGHVPGEVASAGCEASATALDAACDAVRSVLGCVRGALAARAALAAAVLDHEGKALFLTGDDGVLRPLIEGGHTVGSIWPGPAWTDGVLGRALRERTASAGTAAPGVTGAPDGLVVAAAPIGRPDPGSGGYVVLLAAGVVDPAVLLGTAVLCAETAKAQAALSLRNEGLRRAVSEQQAIIDNISDGLLVIERDGRVRHMNGPAGRILALVPGESIGRRFGDLLDFEPILSSVFVSGEGYYDRELIIDTPMRHLHLLDTVVPIRNKAGEVEAVVNTFREIQRARRIVQEMAGSQARYTFQDIIGSSDPLRHAVERARRAACGTANVLLTGESGTGKEVFAQAIHSGSNRAKGPFVAINCAALPRDLIESELFGFAGGSFTGAHRTGRPGKFELASGGTIFLDEITEMPLDVQAKLLRVLQEREVTRIGDSRAIPIDVRVVSASNRAMQGLVSRREFREDLFYRLDVIGIAIPPLRERGADVAMLANHFLRRYAAALDKDLFRLSEGSLRRIAEYDWPGNIRQLENTIERLVNLSDEGGQLEVDLPAPEASAKAAPLPAPGRTLREVEQEAIRAALACHGDNVTRAASALGISRGTLYARIDEYGIPLGRSWRNGTATATERT